MLEGQTIEFQDMDCKYTLHLITQACAAIVFIWLVLFSLGHIAASQIIWAAGASTLASSSYIVFCIPKAMVAKPQKIIGAYIIGMLCGEGMRQLANLACKTLSTCQMGGSEYLHVFNAAAGFSVGISLLFMVLFKLEHPPAAGLAVVMVLDIRNLEALIVILSAAIILSLIRIVFNRVLCDLI